MILPGKHLKHDRALLGVGSEILSALEDGHTVSELWETLKDRRSDRGNPLSFDWFVISLSFLYAIDAVRYDHGVLTRKSEG